MHKKDKTVVAGAVVALLLALCACQPGIKHDERVVRAEPDERLSAIGEHIRALKSLDESKNIIPDGEYTVERIRDKYGIPARVPLVSPHGGKEMAVFVYESEGLVAKESHDRHEILPEGKYLHLISGHNLKTVYLLFEKEPLEIDGVFFAFLQTASKPNIDVVYNDGRSVVSVAIREGSSIIVDGTSHIVSPHILTLARVGIR